MLIFIHFALMHIHSMFTFNIINNICMYEDNKCMQETNVCMYEDNICMQEKNTCMCERKYSGNGRQVIIAL